MSLVESLRRPEAQSRADHELAFRGEGAEPAISGIARYLDRETLISFSLASQSFRRSALPFLFVSVRFCDPDAIVARSLRYFNQGEHNAYMKALRDPIKEMAISITSPLQINGEDIDRLVIVEQGLRRPVKPPVSYLPSRVVKAIYLMSSLDTLSLHIPHRSKDQTASYVQLLRGQEWKISSLRAYGDPRVIAYIIRACGPKYLRNLYIEGFPGSKHRTKPHAIAARFHGKSLLGLNIRERRDNLGEMDKPPDTCTILASEYIRKVAPDFPNLESLVLEELHDSAFEPLNDRPKFTHFPDEYTILKEGLGGLESLRRLAFTIPRHRVFSSNRYIEYILGVEVSSSVFYRNLARTLFINSPSLECISFFTSVGIAQTMYRSNTNKFHYDCGEGKGPIDHFPYGFEPEPPSHHLEDVAEQLGE